MDDEIRTDDQIQLEEAEELRAQAEQARAAIGEVRVVPDDEPESDLVGEGLLRAIEEGLAPLKEQLDDLVRSIPKLRFQIEEREHQSRRFLVIENTKEGERVEHAAFSHIVDAENYVHFLRMQSVEEE